MMEEWNSGIMGSPKNGNTKLAFISSILKALPNIPSFHPSSIPLYR
jgi:hypothetical protein